MPPSGATGGPRVCRRRRRCAAAVALAARGASRAGPGVGRSVGGGAVPDARDDTARFRLCQAISTALADAGGGRRPAPAARGPALGGLAVGRRTAPRGTRPTGVPGDRGRDRPRGTLQRVRSCRARPAAQLGHDPDRAVRAGRRGRDRMAVLDTRDHGVAPARRRPRPAHRRQPVLHPQPDRRAAADGIAVTGHARRRPPGAARHSRGGVSRAAAGRAPDHRRGCPAGRAPVPEPARRRHAPAGRGRDRPHQRRRCRQAPATRSDRPVVRTRAGPGRGHRRDARRGAGCGGRRDRSGDGGDPGRAAHRAERRPLGPSSGADGLRAVQGPGGPGRGDRGRDHGPRRVGAVCPDEPATREGPGLRTGGAGRAPGPARLLRVGRRPVAGRAPIVRGGRRPRRPLRASGSHGAGRLGAARVSDRSTCRGSWIGCAAGHWPGCPPRR